MNDLILKSAWQKKVYKTKDIAKYCRFWELDSSFKISTEFFMALRDIQQIWYEEEYQNSSYDFSRNLNGAEKIFLDLIFRKTIETQKKAFVNKFHSIYEASALSTFNYSFHSLKRKPKWSQLSREEQLYMIASSDLYVSSFQVWESEFHLKNYEVVREEIGLVTKKLIKLCDIGIQEEAWSLFFVPIEIFQQIALCGLLNRNRYLQMKSFESLDLKNTQLILLDIRADFQKFLNKILEVKREIQNIGFVEEHFELAQNIFRMISLRVDPVLASYNLQLDNLHRIEGEKK
ncbi:hypothetical protein MJH12_06680 [bacterium]|nr:hypothetical protein [bacterium]